MSADSQVKSHNTLSVNMSQLTINSKSPSTDYLRVSSTSTSSSPCCSSDVICTAPQIMSTPDKAFQSKMMTSTTSTTTTETDKGTATETTTETSTKQYTFPPLSLSELVSTVQTELQGRADMAYVRAAMEAYDASMNEWKRYEFFDSQKKYTRNLIATDYTTYTLMLLCWNPERGSPVHDHAGSECFMRMISGNVKETQYHWAETIDEHLKMKSETTLEPGQVAHICDEIGLHKVDNPFTSPAVTLHLYMPPYESCQIFMDETGCATESFVTFYSENGELVEH